MNQLYSLYVKHVTANGDNSKQLLLWSTDDNDANEISQWMRSLLEQCYQA